MMTTTLKMAETLERLGLYKKKDWFRLTTLKLLASIEKDMYEGKGQCGTEWIGLHEQLREAKEETERQKGGARIFRLDRSNRPNDRQNHQTES